MFNFALILVTAGIFILVGIALWIRQRRELGEQREVETVLEAASTQQNGTADAVIVAREYGQLVYVNHTAKEWLGVRSGVPTLEYVARSTSPTDSFQSLFAGQTRATFQVGDRWVEGTAMQIPANDELRTVVTLRELTGNGNGNGSHGHHMAEGKLDVSASMGIIGEIGETVNASLSVDQVLQSILAIISKYVDVDAGEITLWDEKNRMLEQRGWLGDAGYVVDLATYGGAYQMGEGVSGWVARHQQPLLIPDIDAPDAVKPKLETNPYRSFVAIPLQLGEQFIGTLELVHKTAGHFQQSHLALLQSIARPVTMAIFNASLYTSQINRINDIANLQKVTRDVEENDTATVYQTLNARIAELTDAAVCGVLLYDDSRKRVIGQPPFHGLPDGLVRAISIPVDTEDAGYDIWQNRDYWVANDLSENTVADEIGISSVVVAAGLQNMVLMVMQIGRQRMGMLMVANKRGLAGFTNQDLQNLQILVAQAAIVVENARLFQREMRHDTELVGLQEITHAIGALSNEDEVYVYSDINTRIAGLMSIQMCGVLLYDEVQNYLVAQPPFYGIGEDIIGDYAIDLSQNDVLMELWEESDFWYTNRAMADTVVFSAGMAEMAELAGVEKTLFASLTAGGRKIGVIEVSNKLDGSDFNDNDARLLMIFATQAAAIIENARLVQEVQRRADEANRLRVIAERAGNLVTMQETLAPVLSEVARLTESQLTYLSTIEPGGALVTHPRAVFGAELDSPLRFDVGTDGFEELVSSLQQPLILNDAGESSPYYRAIKQMHIQRMVIVPLFIGERSLGELIIANRERPYTNLDVDMLTGVAAQFASTIDRVRLFEEAEENLNRRVQELAAISSVSRTMNDTLDLPTILDSIRGEATQATGSDGSTIVMIRKVDDWDGEARTPQIVTRIGERDIITGFADLEMHVLENEDVFVVNHYRDVEMTPQPADAVSAVALAIRYAELPVGVIHLHDRRPYLFDEQSVAFLQTLALEASLAFGNALRQHEQQTRNHVIRQRVEQLNQIFELGQLLQTDVDPSVMLDAIAYSIVQSVGFDVVVITMTDPETGLLRRETQAGLPVDVFERSKADVISLDALGGLLQDELKISESYFYPIEVILEWEIAGLDALSAAYSGNRTMHAEGPDAWRDGDMLLVPISGAGGELLGIISLDRPQDNRRPQRSKIEILEIFAHQAATTIENNRLYLNSVRNAEQEARLNELMEQVTRTLDTDQIVESMAHNALRLAPFTHLDVALRDDDGSYTLTNVQVAHDDTLTTRKEKKSSLEHTALGRTVRSGVDYVYTHQNDIGAYKDLSEWYEDGERVSLIMPLTAGGETLGAIHFGSSSPYDFDIDEFRNILSRISNITAIAVQNAQLFNRAVNLQVFNESVVESIQQGIVVLDRSGRVISANQFMEYEYDWDLSEVTSRRDLFAYSPDLAEPLAEPLRYVLESGEPHQLLNQRTPFGRSFIVRNFYMYPLMSNGVVNGAVMLIEDSTERALLEENVQERANQLAALTRASGKITSSLQLDEVVELALETMAQIVDYDTITMWRRIDAKMMQLVGVRGVNIEMSPPIRADVTEVIRLKQIVDTRHVMTIDNLPHFLESYPYVLPGDKDSKSWLGVPLISEENVTGLMIVTKAEPGFYSPQSEQAALAFANQVAVAISNAELFTETTARTERLSILNRVSLALVQSMDSENIFEIALTEIATALSAEKSRAILFDRAMTSGRVIVDYPRGEKTPTRQINLTTSAMYRYIIERRHPLIFSYDRARMQDMLDDQIRHEIEANGLREYLLLPMMATGRIIGAFEFETRSADLALGAETMEIGLIIANQTAIAIQNANQLEEIRIRERELTTLLEAARSTSLMMDLQQVFEKVADLVINTLDVDDCAIMIWDDLENVLEVQLDVNSAGDPDRISPQGTRFDLLEYPARLQALRSREVIVVDVDDPTADEKERMELTEQQDQVRMLVPLVVRDQSIGLIQIEIGDTDRAITEQERGLARAMGSQVAIAIENARLSTETAAQMDELFIINDLSQAISSTIDVDAMLNIVRQQVPGVTGANEMYVALYDEETDEITFPMAMRDDELYQIPPRKIGTDEVSFIINNRRPLNLDNNYFSAEDLRKSLGLTNGEGDVKSYLGVPLVAGDRVLGVLAVRDRDRTRVFGLNDQRILTTVGSQLGATLQNANLFQQIQEYSEQLNAEVEARTEELEEERDRLDMLYQITAELALTLDMDRVLSRALQMIASAVKAHDGVIMLIDPMTDRLYNRASLSHPTEIEGDSHKTHPAESLASWLIHNEHELLVDDLHEEEFWIRDVEGAELWRSAMAVLLETNEDVQGVLVLLSRDVAAFGEPLLNLVIAASNQVASAINNADLYQLIRDQAERLGTLLRTEQEDAEKSNAILEGIADGVMLTDAEGRISLFNSAAEEMLGLSRNEAMDRTLPELITVHGEEVATWAEPVIRWTSNVDEQDMTLVPADRLNVGDTVVSVNIAPVHIGPQYLGAVSVFRDVTRDVEVDNLKNEFIKSATHELRTPLTPIKGYASMLLMSSTDMPESIREPIRTIKSNADRLAALVEDLLAVSNIDAGESRMNIEPVDLREVVDVQLKNSQNRHFGKELQIQTQYEDDFPRAALDRKKIMQVVNNIIENAFNYTLPGGTIVIELKKDPDHNRNVLLTVADSGVGIPDAFKDKVWDRFARYEGHALEMDLPGTGLGLSIVRDFVNMHNGEVWFESQEGVGTTFFVTLPIEHRRSAVRLS